MTLIQPPGWDPITFNKLRGNQGAIPETYLSDINGPDGPLKHLGKHLPYVPVVPAELVPADKIAVFKMFNNTRVGLVQKDGKLKIHENP